MPGICKVDPTRLRSLTLRHQGSGASKVVQYLGMGGVPIRAHIHWPGSGSYLLSPRTGALVSEGRAETGRSQWRVIEEDRSFVLQQYHLELGRLRTARRPEPKRK